MKFIFLMIVFSMLSVEVRHKEDDQFWSDTLEMSVEKKKPILLVFSGSDWCKPCIKFKKNILEEERFVHFMNENLILHIADFPFREKHQISKKKTTDNEMLAENYNKQGVFPYIILIDHKGEVIKSLDYMPDMNSELFQALILPYLN